VDFADIDAAAGVEAHAGWFGEVRLGGHQLNAKPFQHPELRAAFIGRQRLWRVRGLRNPAVADRLRQRQPAGADEEHQ